jgi:hypothetical protein
MGHIELDRPTAARLEVYEQQPARSLEHVAWMGLAVEQLLGRASRTDRDRRSAQSGGEELAIRVTEIRGQGAVTDKPFGLCDTSGEMGRVEIGVLDGGMQPVERARILGRRDLAVSGTGVVRPERQDEFVARVGPRLHSRVELGDRGSGRGEPTSDLELELCSGPALERGYPDERLARPQPHGQPVRVVEHDGILDA